MHMAAKTAVVALAIFSVTPAGAAWTDDDLTPVEPVRQRDDSAAGLEQLTSAPQLEVQHHSFVGPDGEPITGEAGKAPLFGTDSQGRRLQSLISAYQVQALSTAAFLDAAADMRSTSARSSNRMLQSAPAVKNKMQGMVNVSIVTMPDPPFQVPAGPRHAGETLAFTGYSVDLLNEVARLAGFTYVWVPRTTARQSEGWKQQTQMWSPFLFFDRILVLLAVVTLYVYRQTMATNHSAKVREHVRELYDRFDVDGDGIKPDEVELILAETDPYPYYENRLRQEKNEEEGEEEDEEGGNVGAVDKSFELIKKLPSFSLTAKLAAVAMLASMCMPVAEGVTVSALDMSGRELGPVRQKKAAEAPAVVTLSSLAFENDSVLSGNTSMRARTTNKIDFATTGVPRQLQDDVECASGQFSETNATNATVCTACEDIDEDEALQFVACQFATLLSTQHEGIESIDATHSHYTKIGGGIGGGGLVADFNNDGHMDTFTPYGSDGGLYFNDGTGQLNRVASDSSNLHDVFTAAADSAEAVRAQCASTLNYGGQCPYDWGFNILGEDMNADGNMDIVVNFPSGTRLFLGDGSGNVAEDTALLAGRWPAAPEYLLAGDWNSDGAPDLFISGPVVPASNPRLTPGMLLLSDGAGGMVEATSSALAGPHSFVLMSVLTADLDGDGDLDIWFTGAYTSQSQLYVNDGTGVFSRSWGLTSTVRSSMGAGTTTQHSIAADFDADGQIDLYVVGRMSADNQLLWGTAGGNFEADTSSPASTSGGGNAGNWGAPPVHALSIDVNGDGHLDIVVADLPSQLFFGDGQRGFMRDESSPAIDSDTTCVRHAGGDFDGDGVDDLYAVCGATSRSDFDLSDKLFLADSRLHFQQDHTNPAAYVRNSANHVLAEDLDGDGIKDLVISTGATWPRNANYVYRGTATGTFVRDEASTRHADTWWALAVDVNRDGAMDLFLCEAQRNALLLNDGAGNFAPAAWTGDGTFCASAVSDDFNSDGWPDIYLVTRSHYGNNQLYLSDGTGGYTESDEAKLNFTFTGFGAPRGGLLAIAEDLNEDGHADLLVYAKHRRYSFPVLLSSTQYTACSSGCTDPGHRLFLGDGAGGFSTDNTSLLITAVTVLATCNVAADFDSDGRLDVLVCRQSAPGQYPCSDSSCPDYSSPKLFFGAGSGVYEDYGDASWLEGDIESAIAIDLNGDHVLDFYLVIRAAYATVRTESNRAVYGDGNRGFSAATGNFGTACNGGRCGRNGAEVQAVVAADFNHDGTVDLYVDQGVSNNQVLYQKAPCIEGFVRPADVGTNVCEPCPSYSLHPISGATSECYWCPGGRVGPPGLVPIQPSEMFMCLTCEAGKYRGVFERITSCTSCDTGFYAAAGAGECLQCDLGRVTNTNATGSAGCRACSAGEEPNELRTACVTCALGRYSSIGICQDCLAPMLVGADKASCSPPYSCPVGTICPSPPCQSDGECQACSSGTVSIGTTAACQACSDPGKVANSEQSACDSCAPGQQPSADRSGCVDCTAGAYSSFGIECQGCTNGYEPDESRVACVDINECAVDYGSCDSLSEVPGYAGQSCVNEPAGSYRCGICPDGLANILQMDETGRLNGSSCTFPAVQAATADTPNVQPAISFGFEAAEDFDRILFHDELRNQIALELGVGASEIQIYVSEEENRRLMEGSGSWEERQSTAQCLVVVLSDTSVPAMSALRDQLADQDSLLWTAAPSLSASVTVLQNQVSLGFQCPLGAVMDGSSCRRCPAGQYSSAVGDPCTKCSEGQTSSESRASCQCLPQYYNTSLGINCYAMGYTGPAASAEVCQPCADLACIESCEGDVTIAAGWSVLRQSDSSISVFSCLNEDSCPSNISSTEFDNWTLPSHDPASCATGYTGLLCGECAKKGQYNQEGYEMKPDGSCKDCSEFNVWGVVVMIVVAFVIIYLAMHIKTWFNQVGVITALLEGIAELTPVIKIMIATMQIITGFSSSLNLRFPEAYRLFLDDYAQYFRFDITFLISIGCATDGSYLSTLGLNIMVVVLVVIAVLLFFKGSVAKLKHKNMTATDDEKMEAAKMAFGKFDKDGQGINKDEMTAMCNKIDKSITKKQIKQLFEAADKDGGGIIDFNEFWAALQGQPGSGDKSSEQIDLSGLVSASETNALAADAFGRVSLLAFLLYPGLTAKIFDAFSCRELGPDHAVLAVDYSIDCGSAHYGSIFTMAVVLLILWPFGLPALLFFKLWKAREGIMAEDEDTVAQFDFVLGDYKKEFYYWEVVELARKLILSGVIGLVGRGTVAQSACAMVISFYFFAISFKQQPFEKPTLNRIKAFSEFQIFAILAVCVIIQAASAGADFDSEEALTMDDYGMLLTYLTLAFLPITVYFVVTGFCDAKEMLDTEEETEQTQSPQESFDNPLDDSKHET